MSIKALIIKEKGEIIYQIYKETNIDLSILKAQIQKLQIIKKQKFSYDSISYNQMFAHFTNFNDYQIIVFTFGKSQKVTHFLQKLSLNINIFKEHKKFLYILIILDEFLKNQEIDLKKFYIKNFFEEIPKLYLPQKLIDDRINQNFIINNDSEKLIVANSNILFQKKFKYHFKLEKICEYFCKKIKVNQPLKQKKNNILKKFALQYKFNDDINEDKPQNNQEQQSKENNNQIDLLNDETQSEISLKSQQQQYIQAQSSNNADLLDMDFFPQQFKPQSYFKIIEKVQIQFQLSKVQNFKIYGLISLDIKDENIQNINLYLDEQFWNNKQIVQYKNLTQFDQIDSEKFQVKQIQPQLIEYLIKQSQFSSQKIPMLIIFQIEQIENQTQILLQHKINDNRSDLFNVQIELNLNFDIPQDIIISPEPNQKIQNKIIWRTGLLKKLSKGFMMIKLNKRIENPVKFLKAEFFQNVSLLQQGYIYVRYESQSINIIKWLRSFFEQLKQNEI